ncbi:hypothetical protein N7414_17905 [Pseudomonas sp. GD04087]|uniref:hypothetical protein n=1 Tax=unclassified Pseudomonas TaxID=196821 RepID=UPI00244A4E0E|nr:MULTISPECIES: hypothetical protein [unclassified Pseudomonas]MDH0291000.1 hypothetical protein [Pseudomonas sp. GD04087]MDH1050252.1 hypothetical protein [Pseudomonas sp. GD03903]MDH1998734.1 hypothetical protein [Pseudomonas sp. GD03691]
MAEHKRTRLPLRLSVALLAMLAMLSSLAGCVSDRRLAPPANSEQVTVRITVPAELKAETIEVMYRSTLCTFTDHSAYGAPYQRDGYQNMDIQPVQQGQSDIYEAKVPRNGGGACQWQLSNVTFGVTYREPERFGENVVYGTGGGVVVIFDDNASPRGGANIKVDGDLTIKEGYYPWIDEEFIGGYTKDISLLGDGYDYYLMYQALNARLVSYEPVLHSKFMVYSTGPKEKKKGNFVIFNYPDGSVEQASRAKPDFRRLESIRIAAETK